MLIKHRKPWDIPHARVTPEHVFLNRRAFLGAAGIAAALATQEKQTPREVNLPQLQAQILQQGGILTAPESDVAVGNPRW